MHSEKFSDGTSIMVCDKARSVFYATITKNYGHGAEVKARPKSINETTEELLDWFIASSVNDMYEETPGWVSLAQAAIKSRKTPAALKATLKKKLAKVKGKVKKC